MDVPGGCDANQGPLSTLAGNLMKLWKSAPLHMFAPRIRSDIAAPVLFARLARIDTPEGPGIAIWLHRAPGTPRPGQAQHLKAEGRKS